MRKAPDISIRSHKITCPFDGSFCHYPCDKLNDARIVAGLSDRNIARLLGVSLRTWWRYRFGQQQPKRAVCHLLHVLMGHLPWPGWSGCYVNQREQKLYLEDYKDGITLNDLLKYWWQLQELRALRTTVREYRDVLEKHEPGRSSDAA